MKISKTLRSLRLKDYFNATRPEHVNFAPRNDPTKKLQFTKEKINFTL